MIRRKRFLKMTAATMAMILGCADPASVTADLEIPEPTEVTLAVGDTAQIDETGVMVTLLAVAEDSRCPVGVECVWEGRIAADLRLAVFDEAGDDVRIDSSAGDGSIEWRGLRITLVSTAPEADAGRAIRSEEYRLRLRVEED